MCNFCPDLELVFWSDKEEDRPAKLDEIRKLTDLPPRNMAYLDQLPLFQDELHQLPKKYQDLIDQGPLAQSYFLL